jgi:hypothetical protein
VIYHHWHLCTLLALLLDSSLASIHIASAVLQLPYPVLRCALRIAFKQIANLDPYSDALCCYKTTGKRDGDKDYFLHQPFFPEAQADTCEVTTPSRDMLVGMNEVSLYCY